LKPRQPDSSSRVALKKKLSIKREIKGDEEEQEVLGGGVGSQKNISMLLLKKNEKSRKTYKRFTLRHASRYLDSV